MSARLRSPDFRGRDSEQRGRGFGQPLVVRRWGWREAAVAYVLLLATGTPTIWFLGAVVGTPEPFTTFLPGNVVTLAVASGVLVIALWRGVMSPPAKRLPGLAVLVLLLSTLVCLVAWYLYFVPTWSPGSDNADALQRGSTQILHWEDPYAVTSKFGGPLSPMLGGFLLAIPFVALLGGMYFQPLAWFVGGVCAVWAFAGKRAALVVASLFAGSAWTRMAFPSQSDNWITAAGVVATGSLGFLLLRDESRGRQRFVFASAALYGIALAYRFILWPTVLPLLVLLVRTYGWRRALGWLVPAGFVTVVLVLLPLVINAENYVDGPIAMGLQKGGRGEFPHAALFIALVTVVATVLASAKVASLSGVWGASAVGMTSMLGAVAVTKYELGPKGMVSHYDTVAFSGAVLVFAAVSLALPTASEADGDTGPPLTDR